MSAFFLLLSFWALVSGDTVPHPCSTSSTSSYPFCDTSKSIQERVDNIISLLTLEEKSLLLTARQSPLNWIPRLGITEYDWGGNCLHGVESRCGSHCPTIFPAPSALGATFNMSLVTTIFQWMGMELRALYLEGMGENHHSNLPHFGLNCWSPVVNIGRDPRWGRINEVPSEDPYLSGEYGKYYTMALQNGSKDLPYYDSNYYLGIATLKHFDAYSMEDYNGTTRLEFNAIVSDYMFSDTYFPAFKKSINEGGAKGVMCSYNAVNGIPSCGNEWLLNETLRVKWGFDGYITSDSGAITFMYTQHHYTSTIQGAVLAGLNATCDIDSGGSGDYASFSPYTVYAPELVNSSQLDESYIDMSINHSLTLRFQLGLFDPIDNQAYWQVPGSIINQKSTQLLNLEAAEQTMTLLKNDGNILPLNPNSDFVLGVIGPHYNITYDLLASYLGQVCHEWGDYSCVPSLLNEFNKKFSGGNKKIIYSEGCNVECTDNSGFNDSYNTASNSDAIVLMMGLNTNNIENEGHDRVNISLPGYQFELAYTICKMNKPTVLVLINGGMIGIDGLKNVCPSILEAWYPGFRGSEAIVNTIFGYNNPSGKLSFTMYYSNYTGISDYLDMDLTDYPGKTYKYFKLPVLYPFGYGLSYTKFSFSFNNSIKSNCNTQNGELYCITVSNIGNVIGSETIFVFMYPPNNINSNYSASKLIRQLIYFEKVRLNPNENYDFVYNLNPSSDLVLYDNNGNPMVVNGTYKLSFSNGVDQNLNVNYASTGDVKISPNKYII